MIEKKNLRAFVLCYKIIFSNAITKTKVDCFKSVLFIKGTHYFFRNLLKMVTELILRYLRMFFFKT